MTSDRVARATGVNMGGKTVMFRGPATSLRANKFGMASQIAHQQEGTRRREEFASKMAERKRERHRAAAKAATKASSETGMNAGTMGRSRVSK